MISIQNITDKISHLKYVGNPEALIKYPVQLSVGNEDDAAIMWVNDKNIPLLSDVHHGTIICSDSVRVFQPGCNYIVVKNPRLAFKNMLELFFMPVAKQGIAPSASIHPSVKLGNNLFIGNNVVIEENCTVGNNTSIGHNTIILHGTQIGNNVKMGCNNTIGGVGFGYEKEADGSYSLIPHLGNVVINDNAEIGNNTCIDRGVLGSTTIGVNVKVDNLVHIAHGVIIGKNSLIIANAMIAGNSVIGENVWVAPSVSVINKKSIGDNSFIGIGAVVLKDVNAGDTIVGNPGKILQK